MSKFVSLGLFRSHIFSESTLTVECWQYRISIFVAIVLQEVLDAWIAAVVTHFQVLVVKMALRLDVSIKKIRGGNILQSPSH